jgi:hypothetical protein
MVVCALLAAWPALVQMEPLRPMEAKIAARAEGLRVTLANAGRLTENLEQQQREAEDPDESRRLEDGLEYWQGIEAKLRGEIEALPRRRD